MKPLCVDLYAGLGGWAEGFLAEGWDVIGFDVERHDYGTGGYPGQLVLQDVLTLHGSQFRNAACIVASPPCQFFSYCAMPWTRAKELAKRTRENPELLEKELALFKACFRIQRESCEAAGHHIPMVVENVRGAQPWVGRAKWNFRNYYLWGDVPALMPTTLEVQKFNPDGTGHPPGSWFAIADSKNRGALKTLGHVNQRDGYTHTRHLTNQRESDAVKVGGIKLSEVGFNVAAAQRYREGVKHGGDCFSDPSWPGKQSGTKQPGLSGPRDNGKGDRWFQDGAAMHGSRSDSRKAASAMIAKIPFALAQHIARVYKPTENKLA